MFSLARGYALWILLFKNKWTLFSFHKSYGSWPKDVLLSYLKFGSHHIVTPLVPIGSLSIYLMLYNKSWNRLLLWLVLYLIFFRYLISYHSVAQIGIIVHSVQKEGLVYTCHYCSLNSWCWISQPSFLMLPTAPTCHPSFKFKNRVFIWCLIIFILIVAFIPHVTTCPNLHLNLKTVSLFGALSSSSSLWPSFLTTCPNLITHITTCLPLV